MHADLGGPWTPRNADEVELVTSPGLPSPISALGRGFRRAVKPDLLAPGGRAVFRRSVGDSRVHELSRDRARTGPGQRAAAPGAWPDNDAEDFSFGTSNAAALVSRAAWQVLEALEGVRLTGAGESLAVVPDALLVKALLVHSASWDPGARSVLERALRNPENAARLRDHLAAMLGYGALRTDRAVACSDSRATLIGGGAVSAGGAVEHRVPIPRALNAFTGRRHVIVTLAWFSPVVPIDRRYRGVALDAVVDKTTKEQLGIDGVEADGTAAKRGTTQHVVLLGEGRAARAGADDQLSVTVTAVADAIDAERDTPPAIPYALAVSVEVAEDARINVYEDIRARLQTRVRARS